MLTGLRYATRSLVVVGTGILCVWSVSAETRRVAVEPVGSVIRYDIPGGEHSSSRRAQIAVDDDRSSAVEVELATEELRARRPSDLDDHALRRDAETLPVGSPQDDLLEVLATV